MIELFSTEVGDDFMDKANKVDQYIWEQIALAVKTGQDVIYDAGSWSANDRKYVVQRLKKLGAKALWHQVNCDIDKTSPPTSKIDLFITPFSSSKIRKYKTLLIK